MGRNLRHYFSFFYKIVLGHGSLFHHLHGNVDGAAPLTSPHDSKLAGSEFLQQMQFRRVDLPFVCKKPPLSGTE